MFVEVPKVSDILKTRIIILHFQYSSDVMWPSRKHAKRRYSPRYSVVIISFITLKVENGFALGGRFYYTTTKDIENQTINQSAVEDQNDIFPHSDHVSLVFGEGANYILLLMLSIYF